MVQVIKSEWHQVEKRYGIEIDRDVFGEIYSDIEDEALGPITELPGIRGAFRSRENAEYEIEIRKNGIWLI